MIVTLFLLTPRNIPYAVNATLMYIKHYIIPKNMSRIINVNYYNISRPTFRQNIY